MAPMIVAFATDVSCSAEKNNTMSSANAMPPANDSAQQTPREPASGDQEGR